MQGGGGLCARGRICGTLRYEIAYLLFLPVPSKCMHIHMTASPLHYSSSNSAGKYTKDCTNLCEDFFTTAKLARKSREQKAVMIAPLFPPELTTHDGAKSGNQLTECRAIHRW